MRLAIASLFTLMLLFGMLITVFLIFGYFFGYFSIYVVIVFTILLNFILWLLSPRISDIIYTRIYKVEWISLSRLEIMSPKAAEVIKRVCEKYNFKIPKLGVIPDKNPNAFTYGSGRWNARIIVTTGIFEYLDENEIASVYAHELGHIKNRDFIIMTVASVILQLLYEFYVIFRRSALYRGRKKSGAIILAVISYIFYIIGQYVLLYLSRIREYYADEFSAEHTHANYIASALIKIAYGILANPDNVRLVESTKLIGIMNYKSAKSVGMVYYNCEKLNNFEPLVKALLFDIHNPWARIYEISSTHPLTGKRIKRLCKLSDKPLLDFETIERKYPIDKAKLWKNFLKDVIVFISPWLCVFVYPIIYFLAVYFKIIEFSFGFIGTYLFLLGVFMILLALYKYPSEREAVKTTVLELMSDIYASPVRGKYVEIKGVLVGRGIPGFIFSEDMLLKDETGLIYINYESLLSWLGNLIFALAIVDKLIGKNVILKGWFLRGLTQQVAVDVMEIEGKQIRGFVKIAQLLVGCVLLLIGGLILIPFL